MFVISVFVHIRWIWINNRCWHLMWRYNCIVLFDWLFLLIAFVFCWNKPLIVELNEATCSTQIQFDPFYFIVNPWKSCPIVDSLLTLFNTRQTSRVCQTNGQSERFEQVVVGCVQLSHKWSRMSLRDTCCRNRVFFALADIRSKCWWLFVAAFFFLLFFTVMQHR